jgi:hypothetical protein
LRHRNALGNDPKRLFDIDGHANQRAAAQVQFLFSGFQRLDDSLERDTETILEAIWFEEAQLFCAFITPFLTRSADQAASRIALGQAAIFEDVDLFA